MVYELLFITLRFTDWFGFGITGLLEGSGPTGVVSSVQIFLKVPSPYLCKFRRKPWKFPNAYVDKRGQGLNQAPLVYQF